MKQTTTLLNSTKKKNAAIFHEQLLNFFLLVTTKKIILVFVTALLFFVCPSFISAQSCNQVEILYQAPECLEDKHQGSAGLGGSSCKEIAVCVNQPYTYSSSVTTGWTFNWTVTGPTAVVINPNSTSAVVNIVWPQIGVYTLTLTATDGAGNVFTYCLKVNVKESPVANFTFTPNNVCAGSTISFTNTTTYSGGSIGYSWDFGDILSGVNNYSTSTNPFHTYNAAGVYTVTLVAYSTASSGTGGQPTDHPRIIACCADTITMQVTIIPGSLSIECISTVCSGDTATYTAVGCANPVWLPPVGGTFLNPPTGNTVTIIWGNGNPQGQILAQCPGGCIASVSVPIIPANPIIVGDASPCPNSTTSYSLPELPGTFYNWTLNNISNATNYDYLLNTYPDNNTVSINWGIMTPPGTYHLIINLNNKHICCQSSALLVINPTQPWKAFSDQTVCTGAPGASLIAFPAAGTFKWNVLPPNGGVSPLTGTGPTFNPVFGSIGNYTVEVVDTGSNFCNSGIANPQQIQVTVVGTPAPGIINGPATVCLGSDNSYSMSTNAPAGYHYEWSISTGAGSFQPGNLTTTTGNSATIQWTALSGTISVVLQRNGVPPCPNPVTLNVVQATAGNISGPDSVCVDGTGSYTLSGGNLPPDEIITWSLAAPFTSIGTIISGQGTNSITILWHGQAGAGPWGPVTINASTGCGNATPLTGVWIFPKFTFNIVKTGIDICQGSGVNLAVTGAPSGSTYLWSTGATTSGITNIIIAGTYDVTVTKGGCSFNKQYLVPDPFEIVPVTCGVGICDANDSTNQVLGVTILKPLVGTFTYQWYKDTFPTGTLILGETTPNYTTPTHGKFYVVVTYGNCSKHVSFEVSKVCCPDTNNPQITSVVRNTCNSYTFTGTTPNPYGAPITWYWGDGTQDSGVSGVAITHVYALAGEYCVTFCVGPPSPNTNNCSGNCVATNVTVPIEAAFTYTLGCNGCLSVSNNSIAITSNPAFVTYFWDFGDGDTSVSQNPGIHCYALPGTYVVTLTVTYNDSVVTCTKTATHTITYTPLGIIVIPTPVCSGTASTYSSTPGSYVSYTWDFGDGFTAYTPSSTHIYDLPGPYLVTLTVIDQLGNTCTDTTTVNVLPGIGPCTIQPAFICPGCPDTLSTPFIAGYTYLWEVESIPNVFIPAPGVNTNNTYIVTTPGFYRVIITGVNGCNCITKKVEVKAVPSPKAIISVAPSSAICGSGNITLTSINHLTGYTSDWYANGNYGNLLSSGPVHFEFNDTITTIFNLVLTNEYGCTDTCSFTVIVNPIPVPPNITSSPTLCEGVPISLTVTNYSTNITWNSGFAGTGITVTLAGTYSATYTDSITGCSSSSNITINRRPPVGLFPHYCDSIPCTCRNPQGDFTIYAPKPLIGDFAAIYDIQWYFNNNPVGPNGPNPFFTPAVTGSYHIVVTDPITGCSDTSETYSVIVPLCNQCDSTTCHVDLGNDTTICSGDVFTITSQGCTGTAILYELGPNGPIPIGPGPIWDVSPNQNTCYVVECCDSIPDEINEGDFYLCCCTDTICINVNPLPTLTWSVTYPNACLNSDSIYLDTLNITATPPGGTGVFSGPNVVGNYFYPNSLGTFTITYCYTDTNGCTTCVFNTITVIFCCDSTSCHVDLGNDTAICAGGVFTLTASGCTGTVTWYQLGGPAGPVVIGQGPIIDVMPQQTTCYVVECCQTFYDENGGTNVCCCTDTICITVNPLPTLTWSVTYPNACLNSDSIYLDTLNITATPPGGTGVFSGTGVVGYYFYPNTLGVHTIIFTYTDSNGCTGTVTNTINVIECCDSCIISAGNDTTICAGSVATLHVEGCDSVPQWYMLGGENGFTFIGNGEIIDVMPQQTTCYAVICCCPNTSCCDTDTVCVYVNPLPVLTWNYNITVCQYADSIFLDASTVLVNTNNGPAPITSTGGTWTWSGTGVVGNYFYPNTLGTFTITICYTDPYGCYACVTGTINVIACCNDTSCVVSAGNDTTICLGSAAILQATGCDSIPQWYELGGDAGFNFIGQGEILDVFPQQTTCYAVICCCPNTTCCDTDTVCIYVNPHPVLQWHLSFTNVCQYSDSIFLDASTVFVITNNGPVPITSTGGTWTWSGTGVIGNYFYPNTLGSQTITLCYTDTNGCMACISNTIMVIECCDDSCQVSAGPDQTICAGQTAILNAQGCDSIPTWYMLTGEGPVQVGQGEILDVFPQQTTCYMVICCCPGYTTIACCDTDTVCVYVNPHPVLQWHLSYANVCQYSDSIFLDASNVFVITNNGPVPITSTGGTWTWSGTGVIGNYFYPNTLGTHTITLCYTDTNGCMACISNIITVVECCDDSCQVSAGPDQTICTGQTAILTAQGCDSIATWYMLTGEGPVQVGQGEILDVFPQQTTCYMVICCCPGYTTIACCDTDTVCIYVNPNPVLQWPISYSEICQYSDSIYLDPGNVFVFTNNGPVPITLTAGTWTWSGTGVVGNYFYPNTLGTHTITLCYTDANGCTACLTNTITVIECCDSCQITASNDTSICAGSVAILSVSGCDSIPQWFIISGQEWLPIGQGEILDVMPQQTTCYGVICCCPNTSCCDTDTVCVTVYPPLHLDWPLSYAQICLNSPPVYLDPNNIFVNVNNTMVPLPSTGGTWYFSGTGVFGSNFYPTTLGSHIITLYYTDPNGCTGSITNTITVISCGCDTICQNFNNGMLNGWQADPNAPNVYVILSNFGSQGGGGDYYIQTTDDAGASALMADFAFNEWCCGEFCYDYRIFNDGDPNNTLNVPPIFWVYSGTLGFSFTSNITANETNGWHRVCAPVSTCEMPPDSGAAGEWNPVAGTTMSDWGAVTNNITRIVFRVDYSPFQNEETGIDNVCFYPTDFTVSLTAKCDKICAEVDRCCDTLTYQWSGGTVVGGNCITGLIPNTVYTVTVYNQDGDSATASIMSGPPIDDGNACTEDYCDPVTGIITHIPIIANDGNACTEEYCNPETGEIITTTISCDDGNRCTIDACDPAIGCYYASINPNDYDECTLDGCDSVTGVYHIPIIVDDGNPCTIDGCDPVSGPYHIPVNVDDQNACTEDYCDPRTGQVIHLIISCDDGNRCTIDACDPVIGCYYASINPDDGNECTIDGCDPVTGVYHIPVHVDDQNACTEDYCDPATGEIIHTTISCNDNNPCTIDGCDPASGCYHIPVVVTAGPITGTASLCSGVATTLTYSIPAVAGASYIWSAPSGTNIISGQGTPNVTISMTAGALAHGIYGNICVAVVTHCGSATVCLMLDLNAVKPVQPQSISGPGKACPTDTAVYSIAPVPRATYYVWTAPSGATIISGQGTNIITVVFGSSFTGGSPVSVMACNSCGCSPIRSRIINLNPVTTPGPITGQLNGVCGTSGIYSISPVPAATSYSWILSGAGASFVGPTNGLSVNVSFTSTFVSATLSVVAVNGCGPSTPRTITIKGAPAQPGLINGPTAVCVNTTYPYSVATVQGTVTYTWTAPGTITGQGTKNITVAYGSVPATGQVITVKCTNACGTGPTRTLAGITISFCPRIGDSSSSLSGLQVYPNPAHDELNVEFFAGEQDRYTLQLLDLTGRTVINETGTGSGVDELHVLDVRNLAQGSYFIQLTTNEGTSQIKVIIE